LRLLRLLGPLRHCLGNTLWRLLRRLLGALRLLLLRGLRPLRPLLLDWRLLHPLLLRWRRLRTLGLLRPFGALLLGRLRPLLLLLLRGRPPTTSLLLSLFAFLVLRVDWYHRSHTQHDRGSSRYSSQSHDDHSYSTFVLARSLPRAAQDGRCRAHKQQHVSVHLPC
jgi:hypothetical protein